MAYDANQLLAMSQAELDDLFRASPAGPIPNGSAEGTAITLSDPSGASIPASVTLRAFYDPDQERLRS